MFVNILNRATRSILANRLTYRLYERFLWNQIKNGPVPEHIALILDGNRRYASRRSLPTWFGHELGARKVEELLDWCRELGIRTLTLYAFSTENFRRSKSEIGHIMRIFEEKLRRFMQDKRVHEHKIRIKAIGRCNLLPPSLKTLIKQAEEVTKDYDGFHLNIAVAYGGRAEIVDAMRKISKEIARGVLSPDEIDEKVIEDHLYTSHLPKPDPDLIIRTSGEERLSNFLLWQSSYSELVFLDVFFPELRRVDLWRAIRTYQRRRRRFGR